ncbi:MAG: hypothetical protein J6J36_00810 [Clostridia bacterium]|nr:hypothetical protein [Clostridia bacterium]
MEYGYCNICKKHLEGHNDYVIKNGKKICNTCFFKTKENKTTEEKEKEELIKYMLQLFRLDKIPASWFGFMEKQRKLGRTYSGMQGTLYYFYNIMNNDVPFNSPSAIGIIEYAYDEAASYFKELDKVNAYNQNVDIKTKTNIYNIRIPEKKKININIEDL